MLTEGPHTLTLIATDAAGHTTTNPPIPITVTHQPVGPRTSADFTGDGIPDLITVSGGRPWLSAGDGDGGYSPAVPLAADPGWNGVVAIAAVDPTGAGTNMLIATHADGSLWVSTVDATGALTPPHQVSGPSTVGAAPPLVAAGQFLGNGADQLVILTAAGVPHLWTVDSLGDVNDDGPVIGAVSWGQVSYMFAGDFTGDGIADIVTVDPSGRATLHAGDGGGGFATSVPTWQELTFPATAQPFATNAIVTAQTGPEVVFTSAIGVTTRLVPGPTGDQFVPATLSVPTTPPKIAPAVKKSHQALRQAI